MYEFLNNLVNNRESFFELMKPISEFDLTVKTLIGKVTKPSKKKKMLEIKGRENSKGSKGRGSLTAVLSKTLVSNVWSVIAGIIKKRILNEIGNQKFSVQMDSS